MRSGSPSPARADEGPPFFPRNPHASRSPTFDAQAALGFLISQVSSIEQEVYAIRYGDIQYPNLVPVDTSAYPWARTVTYFTSTASARPTG